jgi:hypothetical protein
VDIVVGGVILIVLGGLIGVAGNYIHLPIINPNPSSIPLGSVALVSPSPTSAPSPLFSSLVPSGNPSLSSPSLSSPSLLPVTPTASPQASLAPNTLIYEANSASGFSSWAGTGQWKTVGGMLLTDGSDPNPLGSDYLAAPIEAPTADYAVEAQIQFVRQGPAPAIGYTFGLVVRDDGSGSYAVGFGHIWNVWDGGEDEVGTWLTGNNQALLSQAYPLNGSWHTYRVEVRANTIRLLVDGKQRVVVTDNRYLTGQGLGLWAQNAEINVRQVRVLSL